MSYDVLSQLNKPRIVEAASADESVGSAAAETFFASLAEIKEMEGEFHASAVVAHFQEVGFNLAMESKAVCDDSLNATGLNASGASLINAAGNVLAQLGLGEHKLLAGESFESEADCINGTVQAGEALDLKAKAAALWKWIQELIVKAKAWVLKQFDGAGKLAKAFEALEKAASAKQDAGKKLVDNAKVKLSTSTQSKLALKGSNTAELDLAKIASLYENASEFVYKKHMTEVKSVVGAFGAAAKAPEDAAIGSLDSALDKLALDKPVQLTDNKQIASVAVEGTADGDAAKKLTFLATKVKAVSPKIAPISATAPKFTDAKEVSPMDLAKIVSFCAMGNNTMTALAKRRDEANKGLDTVKDLEAAMKAVGELDEKQSAASLQLGKIGTSIAGALNTPIVQFGGLYIDTMSACFTYAKDSVALYSK